MDVGVLVTATAESGDLSTVARRAEALGFASLWIPEHPVVRLGIPPTSSCACMIPSSHLCADGISS